jgi:predicted glutamine amidotransferase
MGDTDSEQAFCALMDRLRDHLTPPTVMDFNAKLSIIERWAVEIAGFGVFNFLLSDSRYLYAHRSTIYFTLRENALPRPNVLRARR